MQFNIKVQNDFKNNIRREWALTNGLGGYAGGSVTGAINRTHQGYLIASLHAPVQRYVCFSKTNEKIVTDSHTYDLSSDQFKGGCHTDGIQYIRDFTYDGTICFTYEAGDITIKNTSHWHREKISLPWHMRFKTKAKRLSFDHASYELP